MDATKTWEVPRQEWAGFLTRVEATQRGQPVELEWVGPEVGDQFPAPNARLRALGTSAAGESSGSIELDLGVNDEVDHRVLQAVHLYVVQGPAGQLEFLDIEDERQTKTLLRFKEPRALP